MLYFHQTRVNKPNYESSRPYVSAQPMSPSRIYIQSHLTKLDG